MIDPTALDGFLRDRRVAILSIPREGKAPLSAPIWYDWDGHAFRFQVEATSAKARLLARRGPVPVSVTVQSEVPPYRYAVAYGPATLGPSVPGLRDRVAHRYFGKTAGNMYLKQERNAGRTDDALRSIVVVPERFTGHDFAPEAGLTGRLYFAVWRLFRPVPA